MNLYDKIQAKASTDWLRENYKHIWYTSRLTVGQKAGFLAAVCNPHRCYLMTLELGDRVFIIEQAIKTETWDSHAERAP